MDMSVVRVWNMRMRMAYRRVSMWMAMRTAGHYLMCVVVVPVVMVVGMLVRHKFMEMLVPV